MSERVPALVAGEAARLVERLHGCHGRALELSGAGLEGRRHEFVGRRVADLERRTGLDELTGEVDRNRWCADLGSHRRILLSTERTSATPQIAAAYGCPRCAAWTTASPCTDRAKMTT